MGKYFDDNFKEIFSEPSWNQIPLFVSISATIIGSVFIITNFLNIIFNITIIILSASFLSIQLINYLKEKKINFKLIIFSIIILLLLNVPLILPTTLKIPIKRIDFALNNEFVLSLILVAFSLLGTYLSLKYIFKEDKKVKQGSAFIYLSFAVLIVLFALFLIMGFVIVNGITKISWEFLTQDVSNMGASGGVFPAIIGTILLGIGTALVSIPLGVGTAIYLNEYASSDSKLVRFIRTSVNVLYATPSIVHGLFGLALFVPIFGISLLTGSLILGFLTLPIVIRSSEEALKSISKDIRDASFAMGATRWQTIKNAVLPPALPGIVTGSVLGLGRAFGETAPIMFTAVYFTGVGLPESLLDPVQALSYHLLELTRLIGYKPVSEEAWGTAFLLLLIVLTMNFIGIKIRESYRS